MEQCRTCLENVYCTFKLSDRVKGRFIWEALNSLASVSVSLDDHFPQWICGPCLDKLKQVIEFQLEVEQSDKVLHNKDIEFIPLIKVEDEEVPHKILTGDIKTVFEPIITVVTKKEPIIKQTICNMDESSNYPVKNELDCEIKKQKVKSTKATQNFRCCMCQTIFKTKSKLEKHVISFHSDVIQKNMLKKYGLKQKRQCLYCNQKFRLKRSLEMHFDVPSFKETQEKSRKSTETVVCPVCGKLFGGTENLRMHTLRLHADPHIPCPHPGCGQVFAAQTLVNKHFAAKHSERKHVCNTCGSRFRNKKAWSNHLFVHKEVKQFQCDLCSSTFIQKHILKRHIESHIQEKIYRCGQCEKTYKWDNDLRRHVQLVHEGNAQYKCKYCQKGYFCSSSKKYHEKKCGLAFV